MNHFTKIIIIMKNGEVQEYDINDIEQIKYIQNSSDTESDDKDIDATIEPREEDEIEPEPEPKPKPKKAVGRPRKHPEYYDKDGKFSPKKYRTANKEKHTKDQKTDKKCTCGLIIQKGNMPRHLKSKSHKRGVTFVENSEEHIE